MRDDTLKDYWTFVLHYRRSSAITRADLLGGFLLHQAQHHRSMKVRQLLTAFIARETLGDFDMAALFAQAFDKAGVSAGLRPTILGKYDELRA